MPTLAQALAITTPVSPLLRKARRLGVREIDGLMALAVNRGCRHYAPAVSSPVSSISADDLSDEELTILLLAGENRYEPMAVRCAAQLARSPAVSPSRLARLARMEKTERVLCHIARAGLRHDSEGAEFWKTLLQCLPAQAPRDEPNLPHWTRFVSMPGWQRGKTISPCWLVPRP